MKENNKNIENSSEEKNKEINNKPKINIIGGRLYKKSEKIQNIANELEKMMFGKNDE